MLDLVTGVLVMLSLSVAVFFLLGKVFRRNSDLFLNLLAVCCVAGIGVFTLVMNEAVWLTDWLPTSNFIVLSNQIPLFVAVEAAIAWQLLRRANCRKVFAVGSLAAVGVFSLLHPLLGQSPVCSSDWQGGLCLQTSDKTCSAACAATLLIRHGIPASEAEMAELCLTSNGTSWKGLYRGLKLKTAGTGWDVEVSECGSQDLPNRTHSPMIVAVGISRFSPVDPWFMQEYGWRPGQSHSVIYFGRSSFGNVEIGDPSPGAGHETWTASDFEELFRGIVFRLVPRHPGDAETIYPKTATRLANVVTSPYTLKK